MLNPRLLKVGANCNLIRQQLTITTQTINLRTKSNGLKCVYSCKANLWRVLISSYFHTSNAVGKRRKTSEEKKFPNLKEYSPKSRSPVIDVWHNITVKELAEVLNNDVRYVEDLFLNRISGSDTIISDDKLLQAAVHRSGNRIRFISKPSVFVEKVEEKDVFRRPPPKREILKPRPPVVTIMGHVDHGKTTLLDSLRHTNVVDQEFGGITQHTGAFSVTLDTGAQITFIDTPGHAAFSAMRARGANVTDIVVLVVAADDGVMEQTIESIHMAKRANVPLVVAINKIDAPSADIERTENMLSSVGIVVESLGGDVQAVPISGLKGQNLEKLTEAICVLAELLEIGADPTGPVEGVVIDSKVHPHRGRLSTIIVQRGILHKGDVLIADTVMAKVRVLKDSTGKELQHVSPGFPVEIEGWKELPSAGELVLQVESEKRAKEVIKFRLGEKKIKQMEEDLIVIQAKAEQHEREYKENLKLRRNLGRFKLRKQGPRKPEIETKDDSVPVVSLIIKTDVDGTLEAILNTLETYNSHLCHLDLIHYDVGDICENDVELAEIFQGIIFAFNVSCTDNIKMKAESSNIPIKYHNVIYNLVDDIKKEINFKLPKVEVEEIIGEAAVLQQFEVSEGKKKILVAGCRCTKGLLKRSAMFKIIRNNEVIHKGSLASMRHLKEEVDQIKNGMECGLQLLDKAVTFQAGDGLVCYEIKLEPQVVDWDPGF